MNKILKWIKKWGLVFVVFCEFVRALLGLGGILNIYPLDLFGSRIESIDVNYAYEVSSGDYKIWANETGRKDRFKEYLNRDSMLIGKSNSGRVHNYILTKFKFNEDHGMPNVLHCKAKVWGKRSTNHYPNPEWIICE
jgi:hypothetical protein